MLSSIECEQHYSKNIPDADLIMFDLVERVYFKNNNNKKEEANY